MLRARSGPSSAQMYVGRKTPKRETLSMAVLSLSGAWELGRSLGEEGARALEHVVGGEDAVGGVELGRHAGVEVEVAGALDQPLRLPHRDRATLRDPLGHVGGGGQRLAGGDDGVDEPDLLGPLRADQLADQDQLLRARRAD